MENMMAYCGLICSECPAYIATLNNDDDMKRATAEEWSKNFGAQVNAEDINCMGCSSDKVFGYCSVCEIRACSRENSLNHCGECSSFACGKLDNIFEHVPEAKGRLEEFKK